MPLSHLSFITANHDSAFFFYKTRYFSALFILTILLDKFQTKKSKDNERTLWLNQCLETIVIAIILKLETCHTKNTDAVLYFHISVKNNIQANDSYVKQKN